MARLLSNEQLLAQVAGQTVPRLFARTLAQRPDALALRWRAADGATWEQWTWAEYADRATRLAAGLAELGVGRGDRVALIMRNRPEFHVTDLAVLLLGATPISIYQTSAPEQIAQLVGHCGARVVVVEDGGFLARVRAAGLEDLVRHVVVVDATAVDVAHGPVEHWDALLGSGPVDLDGALGRLDGGSLATVIYTSGTTGPPKGVQITNQNVCWTVASVAALFEDAGLALSGWRIVSYLPMAHIAERMVSHYLGVAFALEVTTCPELLQVGSYLGATRPQLLFGVPRVYEKMHATITSLAAADNDQRVALNRAVSVGHEVRELARRGEQPSAALQTAFDETEPTRLLVRQLVGLDALEVAASGAAPISLDVLRFFDGLGVPISEVYGLSEDTGPLTWDVNRHARLGTVGRPIPGCEIRLGPDGEILASGGHIFPGYLDDPERTAEVLQDGWLHTGDIGSFDADGYLSVVDRKKELIITAGGKNISPANVETALKASPLVSHVAVIGDRRPYVSALIVLDADAVAAWATARGLGDIARNLAELARHPDLVAEIERAVDAANAHFSPVEQVRRFLVLGDEWLPDSEVLTPTMKLKRRGVASRYGVEIEALYR
jgi:long-chain acyl-CoA synthetase